MAAELPALVAHSILEIVRGMWKLKTSQDQFQCILYTSIPIDCVLIMSTFSEEAQTELQICPWALVWAFHIVRMWS